MTRDVTTGTRPEGRTDPADGLCVLYNGDCPICSREIAAYRGTAERQGLPLRFEDLNRADLDAWGLDAESARARLHVRRGGEVLAGLPAFVALWERMPRLRWLAWLVQLPGLRGLATELYDRVLAPGLAALDRRRRRRTDRRQALSRQGPAR